VTADFQGMHLILRIIFVKLKVFRCEHWNIFNMWAIFSHIAVSWFIQHLWALSFPGFHTFMDMRMLYLMCIFVCLATSWTGLTI